MAALSENSHHSQGCRNKGKKLELSKLSSLEEEGSPRSETQTFEGRVWQSWWWSLWAGGGSLGPGTYTSKGEGPRLELVHVGGPPWGLVLWDLEKLSSGFSCCFCKELLLQSGEERMRQAARNGGMEEKRQEWPLLLPPELVSLLCLFLAEPNSGSAGKREIGFAESQSQHQNAWVYQWEFEAEKR